MPVKEETAERDESPYVGKFVEFFESQYKKEIERLVGVYPEKRSLNVNFKDLEQQDIELADALIEDPDNLLAAAEAAISQMDIPALEITEFKPHVRFFNLPKQREPLIRDISAQHLGKMIAVEGVVRQITGVMPKLKVGVWKCRRCGNTYRIEQDIDKITPPAFCECRHRDFELVEDQSEFVDSQKVEIQESLERLKGNEQAAYLEVHALDDIVNRINLGNKTMFVGVLRLRPSKVTFKTAVYERYLDAVHLEETEKEFDEVEVTPEEEKQIKHLAKSKDIYDKLIRSIAPAIYGHEVAKGSIILQLFGGVKKFLPGNQTIRGNIHVLLVGDPSCLVGDERIVLGNGAIEKIGRIGSRHLEGINLQVLTGEGAKKRDLATVFHYFRNQPIIEIVTESGKSIKGTPNHPLQCVSKINGSVARYWKRLDEFIAGDKVAVVTSIPCTITAGIPTGFKPLEHRRGPKFDGLLPEKVTPELAAFLGYALGDGWARKYETGFVVAETEADILKPLVEAGEKLFGKKPSVVRRKTGSFGKKPASEESKKPAVWLNYATIHSRDIAHNLRFLREKRVPDIILKSGNRAVAEFLKWLYTADGCVFSRGRGRRSVSLKAKDVELLRDVQMLLLRFGIHSRIIENNLFIRRGKDIIKFSQKIGFASEKKKSTLKRLALEARSFARFNGQRSERIVKIIRHSPEDVFDI